MADERVDSSLDDTITWGELLDETAAALGRKEIHNPASEARWLVEAVTGMSGPEFFDVCRTSATVRGVAHLESLIRRRAAGEPIQYVLGSWSFRTLDLMIDRRVLIPRPETEVVAGLAIDELDRQRPNGRGTVVDLGTGSGAIGLSVAAERVTARVLLTDRSTDALAVARANLAGLGLAGRGVEIAAGSWYDAVPDRYEGECDVIVSNPPYVRTTDTLPSSVADWEPPGALLAGDDGLDDLRCIVSGAPRWLRPGGALVLEMDPGQTTVVADLAEEAHLSATVHPDLAGLDRAVVARRR